MAFNCPDNHFVTNNLLSAGRLPEVSGMSDGKERNNSLQMYEIQTSEIAVASKKAKAGKAAITRNPRMKWSKEEDERLVKIVGTTIDDPMQCKWPNVAKCMGNGRTAKQCRDRWLNYLRPGIKKGSWSSEEEMLLSDMYDSFGPKWMAMATILENRTDNDIKNKWYSMQRVEQRRLREAVGDTKSLDAPLDSLAKVCAAAAAGVDSSIYQSVTNDDDDDCEVAEV
ncbi:hypothetical protein MPSEU_000386900 [Mayamaea pseudoterrestris]|nr:hypothetical protein MPSEU_000386900 [Mayamaea pseudoterrestris]